MKKRKIDKTELVKRKKKLFLLAILPLMALFVAVNVIAFIEFGDGSNALAQSNSETVAELPGDSETPLYEWESGSNESYLPKQEIKEVTTENAETLGGDVTVLESSITEDAFFYNYKTTNEILIQLIFLKAPDGSLRVGVNYCKECAGAQDAYFEPGEGIFRCAHGGHVAAYGEIGISDGAPQKIAYSLDNGNVVVKEADLETFEEIFKDLKLPNTD